MKNRLMIDLWNRWHPRPTSVRYWTSDRQGVGDLGKAEEADMFQDIPVVWVRPFSPEAADPLPIALDRVEVA